MRRYTPSRQYMQAGVLALALAVITGCLGLEWPLIAVASLLFNALKNNVGARPGPILRINVLQHYEVIQVLGNLQRSQFAQLRRARIRGVRRPEQGGRTPRDRFQQQLSRVQLQPDMFRPANRQVRMVVSVIPDFVTFISDASD